MTFELENWQGLQSVPRVLQLQSLGATKTAIAKRFQISRPTLDKALARFNELLKEEAVKRGDPPAPELKTA